MKLVHHCTNCMELVTRSGTAVLFSYGQLIGVKIHGSLFILGVSPTTAKHITKAGYRNGEVVTADRLLELYKEV